MNFSAATGGLMFLFGTRPEAIKLCPLFLALARESVPFTVVDTGQHHDMVAPVLHHFGCPAHEQLQLAHPNQTPLSLIRLLLERLPPLFAAYRPVMVAVHGDTASAFG
ncbi:MAG: UDP-N-acetylglucosamine 2-epimerase, partial [Clostridia bacterium]|nr:UDP-N-acetylglucosamine 2-epimerase [Clostridia bacterium]